MGRIGCLAKNVAAYLVYFPVAPLAAHAETTSSRGEHFVPHQMQANPIRRDPIEVERLHSVPDIFLEVLPSVALREDVRCQTLRAKAAIRFLGNLEDEFHHPFIVPHTSPTFVCLRLRGVEGPGLREPHVISWFLPVDATVRFLLIMVERR